MDNQSPPSSPSPESKHSPEIRIFGIGSAGISVMDRLIASGLPAAAFVAVDTRALTSPAGVELVQLPAPPVLRPSSLVEAAPYSQPAGSGDKLRALCEGIEVVFIVAGLGGGAGTGLSPVVARAARAAGALVLVFAMTPFECEGSYRQQLALQGLEELKEVADGVVCLPIQKVTKIIDENTRVLDAFKLAGELLADAVLGIWRLLRHKGLIEIHVADLCDLLRGRHADCAFAVAQAAGATRSRDVLDRLLAHPMLDGGETLAGAETVLVSLMGGPDLALTEVNRVMEGISQKSERAHVMMGAAIDPAFGDQLGVTLIAARRSAGLVARETSPRCAAEPLDTQLVERGPATRPGSRFVPPAPVLPQEKMRQMFAEQGSGPSRPRKARPKMRQGQLPLEIVSKGRFDKSEPTIYKGEDLDVPTYIRRGVSLN